MASHMRPDDLPYSKDEGMQNDAAQTGDVQNNDAQGAVAHREFEPLEPPKKKRNWVSNLLIVVGVVLLIVAGGMQFKNVQNYKKIDEENERVAEYAKLSNDENNPPEVDWAALKEMNPDVVGWLQVPGTVVNYPVFQTGDNDYYLDHAPDQSYSIGGSVFLDFDCTSPGMVDTQTIVYGHHMRNGSQFKQIADMDAQTVFDTVKTVWYVTEQKAYNLTPLFLFYTYEEDRDVRQFTFENNDQFREYLKTYFGQAVTMRPDAEQLIGTVNKLFTLSTCNYYDGYGRTLLVCVPKDEIPGTPEYEAAEPARQEAARQAEEARKAEEARQAEEAARQAEEEEAARRAAEEQAQVEQEEEVVELSGITVEEVEE